MAQLGRKSTFEAGNVRFAVQHELWDGNIDDHSDQGVAILVVGQAGGKDTTLLRFNCFDLERSYVYGPETVHKLCRMDPTVDGNPIGWSVKQLKHKLPAMLRAAEQSEGMQTVRALRLRPGEGRVIALLAGLFATYLRRKGVSVEVLDA